MIELLKIWQALTEMGSTGENLLKFFLETSTPLSGVEVCPWTWFAWISTYTMWYIYEHQLQTFNGKSSGCLRTWNCSWSVCLKQLLLNLLQRCMKDLKWEFHILLSLVARWMLLALIPGHLAKVSVWKS